MGKILTIPALHYGNRLPTGEKSGRVNPARLLNN